MGAFSGVFAHIEIACSITDPMRCTGGYNSMHGMRTNQNNSDHPSACIEELDSQFGVGTLRTS